MKQLFIVCFYNSIKISSFKLFSQKNEKIIVYVHFEIYLWTCN